MPTALKVVPLAERIARIENASVIRQHFMPFKGQNSHDVKELPLDLPVYRMTNMRTDVLQLEFVEESGKPDTFFTNGQEDPEAQAAQHAFLLAKSKDPKKNIYERLSTVAEQNEPLAVTKAGVILNGNRRLAAMRALFAQDPVKYSRFENVQVAVLPDADESELTALETDLQIAEDYRQPYGWIEEARGLRRQIDVLKWDFARAQSHWGKKEADLKALLSRLALAEEYLEYRKQPRHYTLVEGDEQAFITLQRELASQAAAGADASQIEFRKYVEFAVLAQPAGTVSGSTHSYAAKIDDIATRVLADATVRAVTGWTPPTTPPIPTGDPAPAEPTEDPGDDDPLAGLPTAPATTQVPVAVLTAVKDPAHAAVIAIAADQARDDIADEAKAAKRGGALAKSAQQINSMAAALSLTNASDASLLEAAVHLSAALPTITDCLRQILDERPEVGASLDLDRIHETSAQLAAIALTDEP